MSQPGSSTAAGGVKTPAMIILAGGLGTRLSEETAVRPKPMVTIGGKPILWHIMKGCREGGIRRFVVALGHNGDVIKEFLLHLGSLSSSFTVDLKERTVSRLADDQDEDWIVTALETGETTSTGGRIKRAIEYLDEERAMVTYGDAVTDLDVRRVLTFHAHHGTLATVTAVRPQARFGRLELRGDRVEKFGEKPQSGEGWINGGFFVLERGVADFIAGDGTTFEIEPLSGLAEAGQLVAYRHEGFWHPMDTLRERNSLEAMWQSGSPAWRTWE